jgi:hypothetical protein
MRRVRTLGVILAATALFAVPASAQRQEAERLPSVALPAELERVLTDYETAWTARDAAGLAALFAPDGFVMAPGMPPRIHAAAGHAGGPRAGEREPEVVHRPGRPHRPFEAAGDETRGDQLLLRRRG